MKKNIILALALLISVGITHTRLYSFFADGIFQEMEQLQKRMYQLQQEAWAHRPVYNKEEAKALKKARKNLLAIKPEVSQNNENIIIKFPLNDSVDAKNITVTTEDTILKGVIPCANGQVEFTVFNNYLELSRRIEIKKENKSEENKQSSYYSDLTSKTITLPQRIDINSVKASVKDKVLTLLFTKKKQSKISIAHT
jgi:hypothetical protein